MKHLLKKSYLLTVFTLIYIPILVLMIFSLNNARYSLVWHGFSLKWYLKLFQDTELWTTFTNSVVLGLSASTIATIIGLFTCFNLFINSHKKPRTLRATLLFLIIIPDIILGISLLVFFNFTNIPLGFLSLLITHITFCLPFVVLTIDSQLSSLDTNLYYGAIDLGASPMQALFKVFLPILWPAILSAFLLCFTLSFDDVVTSYFVAGPSFSILPLTIYSLIRSGITPELNALCTITIAISIMLVITAHLLVRRRR